MNCSFQPQKCFFFTMPYLTYILQSFLAYAHFCQKFFQEMHTSFSRIVYFVLLILWYNVLGKLQKSLSFYFRRAFQLLSSGLFLPGSLGIIDPCEVHVIVIFRFTLYLDLCCKFFQLHQSHKYTICTTPHCSSLFRLFYKRHKFELHVHCTSLSDVFSCHSFNTFSFCCFSQEMCVPTVF